MDHDHPTTDDGPGCEHAMCAFERDCFVAQDEAELRAAREDRAHRHLVAGGLAAALGLTPRETPVLEAALFARNVAARIRAADLLAVALRRVAARQDEAAA